MPSNRDDTDSPGIPEMDSETLDVERERDEPIEDNIRELKEIREANLETLGELMGKYREVRELHLELDDVVDEYREFLKENDVSGRLMEEYGELLRDHVDLLEEQSESARRSVQARMTAGIGSILGGISLAELYLPEQNFIDFYLSLPEVYSQSPEIGAAAVGLPAAGVYALKKAYDKQDEYNSMQRELGEYSSREEQLRDP